MSNETKTILINAIITTVITFSGVLLTWYLSRYKLTPKNVPPARNIKDAMKRIGKRLIKGVAYIVTALMMFGAPLFRLFSELRSDAPITRSTLITVAINVFLFTSSFCLTIVFYFGSRVFRLIERHVDVTSGLIDRTDLIFDTFNQTDETRKDKTAT